LKPFLLQNEAIKLETANRILVNKVKVSACVHACVSVCASVCVCAHARVYVCVHVSVCTCVCVHVSVCVCVHANQCLLIEIFPGIPACLVSVSQVQIDCCVFSMITFCNSRNLQLCKH
jgi:hypothetical protein